MEKCIFLMSNLLNLALKARYMGHSVRFFLTENMNTKIQ